MALKLRFILCVLLVSTAAACQTSVSQRAGAPYFVKEVEVVDGSNSRSATNLARNVEQQARMAMAYYPKGGDAKVLKIVLTDLHYRRTGSPLSLVARADTHRLVGYGTVFDKETGRNEGSFPLTVAEPNILGRPVKLVARGSGRQRRTKIEQELAGKFAAQALQHSFYGRLAPTAKVRTALFRESRSLSSSRVAGAVNAAGS